MASTVSFPMITSLKPGDLIEIHRWDDNHWAVYIGDNEVVHFVTKDSGPNRTSSKAEVKRENLRVVVNGNSYRVNNVLDDKYEPRDPEVIVTEAKKRVGQTLKYNVISYNCKHLATELRYDKAASRQSKLNPGDLIEIHRGKYNHWAVYIGGYEVVHFVTLNPGPLLSDSEGEVMRQNLSDVVNGNRYQVNNVLDDKYKPRDPEVIVTEAKKRVGQPVTYRLVGYNCEHFATELRYDKPESRQVRDTVIQVATALLPAPLGHAVASSFRRTPKRRHDDTTQQGATQKSHKRMKR